MKGLDNRGMVVGPVAVELIRREALLAVVKDLHVVHALHVHGASRLVRHAAALAWELWNWYGSIALTLVLTTAAQG